ncbi:hypothetical protein ACJX0J_028596, partial [Zea mays]
APCDILMLTALGIRFLNVLLNFMSPFTFVIPTFIQPVKACDFFMFIIGITLGPWVYHLKRRKDKAWNGCAKPEAPDRDYQEFLTRMGGYHIWIREFSDLWQAPFIRSFKVTCMTIMLTENNDRATGNVSLTTGLWLAFLYDRATGNVSLGTMSVVDSVITLEKSHMFTMDDLQNKTTELEESQVVKPDVTDVTNRTFGDVQCSMSSYEAPDRRLEMI